MLFRVSGASFRKVILNVAGAGAKKSVNLTFTKGQMRVQASGVMIVEDFISVMEQDTDYESFSATMSGVIALIKDTTLDIVINGDTMSLTQVGFSYSVLRNYTEPIEYACDIQLNEAINKSQLSIVAKDIRAVELVVKGLGKETFNILVSRNKCYIDGQCLAYEAPLQLQDITITNKVFKELARSLSGNWCYGVQNNVLVLRSGRKRMLVAAEAVDKHHVSVLSSLGQGMKLLASGLEVGSYAEMFEALYKVYNSSLVNLIIGSDGLCIFIDNGEARIVAGYCSEKLCTVQLSMQQAMSIIRIMGQYGSLDVYRGSNKICLVQRSSNKKLTLAGSVF